MSGVRSAFALCLLMLIAGCSGNDQYSAEREYWQLSKRARQLSANPAVAPASELESVIGLYANFIRRHKGTVLAVEAEFMTARLLMLKPDQGSAAREYLGHVAAEFDSPEIKAEASFLAGTTLQENDWQGALARYKQIIEEYPLTKRGLAIPVYIAECHRERFEPVLMSEAYLGAVSHYIALSGRYPGSQVAYESGLMRSRCYGGLRDWKNSVQVLEQLFEEFSRKVRMDAVLLNIALIYKNELRDWDGCRDTLARLLKEYPDSRLAVTAKGLMQVIGKNDKRG